MKTKGINLLEAMEAYKKIESFINGQEDYDMTLPEDAEMTSPWEDCLTKKCSTRFDKECRRKLKFKFDTNTSSDQACTVHYKGIDLNILIHYYCGTVSKVFGYTNTNGNYKLVTIS